MTSTIDSSLGSNAALATTAQASAGASWLGRIWSRWFASEGVSQPSVTSTSESKSVDTADDLVDQMLRQQRYALLLRPAILDNLTPKQREIAREQLRKQMSVVPQGEIRVGRQEFDGAQDSDDDDDREHSGVVVRVDAFLLDRSCVTNQQFQAFVDAGGYEQMAFWDREIWPGVLDFVDQTGYPAPRFWRKGKFAEGLAMHPVVGVSWFEAAAYARWAGKRLPTDPEWEKAAAWPSQMSASRRPTRRFPWGDSLERNRANLWMSNIASTVPVDEFADGVSVGGIYQLIGNVWEWTATNFGAFAALDDDLVLPAAFRSIRGGAFDTYFEAHATCQFQSGEDPTARLPNIGFRCAVSLCDLRLEDGCGTEEEPEAEIENNQLVAEVPV